MTVGHKTFPDGDGGHHGGHSRAHKEERHLWRHEEGEASPTDINFPGPLMFSDLLSLTTGPLPILVYFFAIFVPNM